MEKEIWVPIKFENIASSTWVDYAGKNYEVSNFGRIRNKKTGNMLTVSRIGDGDAGFISHYTFDKGCDAVLTFRVSHLVWGSFIGNCYDKKIYHRDGNNWNNRLDNLYMK